MGKGLTTSDVTEEAGLWALVTDPARLEEDALWPAWLRPLLFPMTRPRRERGYEPRKQASYEPLLGTQGY